MAGRNSLEPPVQGHPLIAPHAPATGSPVAHRFDDPRLLAEALTHRSAAHDRYHQGGVSNERLEFIGDRVLGLVVAEWLAERFAEEREGALARRLAHLVSRPVLAAIAERAGLGAALSVAPNEARAGVGQLATVLADAMEAVIGAIYLDAGLAPARDFIRAHWQAEIEAQREPPQDPKTALQEWLLGRGLGLPAYAVSARSGPPHAPDFTVTATAAGRAGTGSGSSKRLAERAAAASLLADLMGRSGRDVPAGAGPRP